MAESITGVLNNIFWNIDVFIDLSGLRYNCLWDNFFE